MPFMLANDPVGEPEQETPGVPAVVSDPVKVGFAKVSLLSVVVLIEAPESIAPLKLPLTLSAFVPTKFMKVCHCCGVQAVQLAGDAAEHPGGLTDGNDDGMGA